MTCVDEYFMDKALELSKKGIGFVNPNPIVGALIVKDGDIIGSGYHEAYGKAHAEINAFNSVKDNVEGATMYITLEPCSHYGKNAPCVNEIIRRKIKRVVIAMKDPNPLVSGKGIELLLKNNIDVKVGVLEEEAEKNNEIFIKYIKTKKPFCILKAGMSLDGKIATYSGESKWITSDESRKYSHKLRNKVSGILVGINTVLKDDPILNIRIEDGVYKNPTRIVLDSHGKIPLKSKLLTTLDIANTMVVVTEKAAKDKIKNIENTGAEVIVSPLKEGKVDLNFLVDELGKRKIDSILIEGGGEVNFSFLKEDLVDKAIFFIAPKIIGGASAKTPVEGRGIGLLKDVPQLKNIDTFKLGKDLVVEGYL
ncbi:bifunctional diaminohydroxyphosphoribosylaminopyrimidine deaminase/5-amino-6-(5-phosphoribosylamino)uracil reductase RibD [Anaerosalibacter massiliensis]|uniref:Riboflavin biosynthesis protein RibD n=1 Tax=Anaerosalibacter massiliensis TaxID=1347392 RepID=A0A9X2MGQ2_9FIRM|nr:bifunctional diaminohydroxyphosphoribosylaminopyrimidine deaminase/5-amino-6-(5-phosphoribosylamino)uracil reductase RibD [Anaerosalibacter massiliensis]MCR2043241.1 bifunctional diaminohydroxyphosphoribosylaminopyrimidine deaminase/5-amino-6-(5-phosphoribosylamino)uracil reductase RibD [Anaerosalibacter massiliensis]